MKTLTLLLIALSTYGQGCLKLDLVVLGDYSGSVMGYQSFVSDAITSLAKGLELSEEGVKMSTIIFNDSPTVVCSLTDSKKEFITQTSALKLMFPVGETYLLGALKAARDELFGVKSRDGYNKMIILISDGRIYDTSQSVEAVNELRKLGVRICTILIKSSTTNEQFLQQIALDCYVESDYENLASEINKLDICS